MSEPLLLLTDIEAAKILGVCPRTVFTLADKGKLPRVRLGRSVRFDPRDVEKLIQCSKAARRKGAS